MPQGAPAPLTENTVKRSMAAMKWTSHLLTLALGIAFGITWANRPGQTSKAPKPVQQQDEPAPAPTELQATVPVSEPAKPTIQPVIKAAPESDVAAAIANDDILAATKLVQDLEKSSPNSEAALEGRASLLGRMNDWKNAKTTLQRCLELHPESTPCLRALTQAEMNVGTEEDQEKAVINCLNVAPNDPECKGAKVTLRMNQEDYDEAVSILEELNRDNGRYGARVPQESLDWQMALTLEEAGRESEAASYFDRACRANVADACRRIEMMKQGF